MKNVNEKLNMLLVEYGWIPCEESNNSIYAYKGNITVMFTPIMNNCYSAKAVDMPVEGVLELFRKEPAYFKRGAVPMIGVWAYHNRNLPMSSKLLINNHDHSLNEIEIALKRYKEEYEEV